SCGMMASTCSRSSGVNGASTYSDQSLTPSGKGPTPMRRRAYCGDRRALSMLFRPLWPPAEPSPRSRNAPDGIAKSATRIGRPRVLGAPGAEAEARAQASALRAAPALLGCLRPGRSRAPPSGTLRLALGRRAAFGRRPPLALFLLALTDLADELGLGHLGRR